MSAPGWKQTRTILYLSVRRDQNTYLVVSGHIQISTDKLNENYHCIICITVSGSLTRGCAVPPALLILPIAVQALEFGNAAV